MVAMVPGLRIAARVLAAVAGAYAVTAGAAAMIAVLLVAAIGLSRSDALIVGSSIGYLLFTFLMLWCFAERRLLLVWLVLVVAALVTHGAAILMEPSLPLTGGTP